MPSIIWPFVSRRGGILARIYQPTIHIEKISFFKPKYLEQVKITFENWVNGKLCGMENCEMEMQLKIKTTKVEEN